MDSGVAGEGEDDREHAVVEEEDMMAGRRTSAVPSANLSLLLRERLRKMER